MQSRAVPWFTVLPLLTIVVLAVVTSKPEAAAESQDAPHFTQDNQMLLPDNYREWVWVGSGFGMSYRPGPTGDNPDFDNVFVNPSAYRSFVTTGTWPDKTVLVLEVRRSASKGSINQNGHYQTSIEAVEVHVKDERRFPGKWAFFGFAGPAKTASMIPRGADCYSCHQQHGAVDTTFVQFYPTLLDFAEQKGTVRAR
jgi:hypothetical protein